MFLEDLIKFGGMKNLILEHHWHGVNMLLVLECCLLAVLICLVMTAWPKFRRLTLVGALLFSTAAYAASSTLSNLSASAAVGGTDTYYTVQTPGAGGVKSTAAKIATYVFSLFSQDCTANSTGTITCTKTNNVSFSALATTTPGTGVATALGNNVNTNGGVLTASTAAIASNAIVTGAGSGTALTGTTPGTGVLTALAANLSANGGLTTTIASGAKALATSAISSAACTSAQTDTATNTATTDTIIATFNGDPTAVTGYVPLTTGMLTIIAYPTANTVNFKVCNNTGSSITPGAITINWRVVR